jgi:hypothetical protein
MANPPQIEAIGLICNLQSSESCNKILFHGNLMMITGTKSTVDIPAEVSQGGQGQTTNEIVVSLITS